MRVLVACKRGTPNPPRNKHGHCLCDPCREFNRARWMRANNSPAKQRWKEENKERLRQYSRAWIDRNPEQRREIEKNWKSRNPDRVAEYNAKSGAKWSRENSGKRNALTMKRKAAKLQRTPPWVDHSEIKEIYDLAAEVSKKTGVPHEVDHIIPLHGRAVSGLHVPWNLQVITRRANRSKGIRLIEEENG